MFFMTVMAAERIGTSASRIPYSVREAVSGSPILLFDRHHPSVPTCAQQCRRAQRRSRMARLRATASAARSVLDGREHGGMLGRVGGPVHTDPTIQKRTQTAIKNRDHAHLLKLSVSPDAEFG